MLLAVLFAVTNAVRVLYIQQRNWRREPIVNDGKFQRFDIRPTQYTLGSLTRKRNCSENANCYLVDYVAMLRMINETNAASARRYDYYYAIEDDTFYCAYDDLLERLLDANAHLNVSILFTGIGASGYAVKMSMIKRLINSAYKWRANLNVNDKSRFGIDVMFWDKKSGFSSRDLFRTKVHMNAHLYQGSTRVGSEGRLNKNVYGACFESSCGIGPINTFNHRKCHNFDIMSLAGVCEQSSRGVLPRGYFSTHCMRQFKLQTGNGVMKFD